MQNLFSINSTYLTALGVPEPFWEYRPYSVERITGSGLVRGSGWAEAIWHWDFITRAAYLALKTYCPDASASVTISTKVSTSLYTSFSAILVWPMNVHWANEVSENVTLRFQGLE